MQMIYIDMQSKPAPGEGLFKFVCKMIYYESLYYFEKAR